VKRDKKRESFSKLELSLLNRFIRQLDGNRGEIDKTANLYKFVGNRANNSAWLQKKFKKTNKNYKNFAFLLPFNIFYQLAIYRLHVSRHFGFISLEKI